MDGNQHPRSRIPALSALRLRRATTLTPVSWYFRLYLWGSKGSNGESSQQEVMTDWRGCLCAESLARLWGSPATSPGAAPPPDPQRETAVIVNMCISMHMRWGMGQEICGWSCWRKGICPANRGSSKAEVLKIFWGSLPFEKLTVYIYYLLGLCLIASYIYRWLPVEISTLWSLRS